MDIENPTDFVAAPCAVADTDGADLLVVLLKATYALDGTGGMKPADEQRDIVLADEYAGDPSSTGVAYASDLSIGKLSTDVVLSGSAYPAQSGAREGEVGIRLGAARASFRVFGDREWQSALGATRISRPRPFERIRLRYEACAGGTDSTPSAEKDCGYDPRNPVGRGFRSARTQLVLDASPLPNFERADALIRTPDDRPAPAPVGFVAPGWQPRAAFAGTYDDAWTDSRSPLLPSDFDARFFDVAPPELTVEGRLRGDEHGAALGVSPYGLVRFTLPGIRPTATVAGRALGLRPLPMELDRVVVDGDANAHGELVLVWSVSLRIERGFHDLQGVSLSLN